ncbi:hypothetical protein, partial [Bacillus thuringiensis]|uniref:hypothetical protein n=1 Tax=Bacillus thuringiensis TaxID=1428 RepID=UPI001C92DA6B
GGIGIILGCTAGTEYGTIVGKGCKGFCLGFCWVINSRSGVASFRRDGLGGVREGCLGNGGFKGGNFWGVICGGGW